jgi:hypothetical protein
MVPGQPKPPAAGGGTGAQSDAERQALMQANRERMLRMQQKK